jgi:hypothetical protein
MLELSYSCRASASPRGAGVPGGGQHGMTQGNTSSDQAPNGANVLYEYRLDWSKGSERRHIDGERRFVERFIPMDEFKELFGGYALLRDRSGGLEFLGVWGRQEIARFKRALRSRGAVFIVRSEDTNNRVIKSYVQFYGKDARSKARLT